MEKLNRFQKLVAEARRRIKEISPGDAAAELERGAVLMDVREKEDWERGRAASAIHLPRGIVELEIEEQIPAIDKPIIYYCGGRSRSALVTESLQKMGYTNVLSFAGGFKAWKAAGLPVDISNR